MGDDGALNESTAVEKKAEFDGNVRIIGEDGMHDRPKTPRRDIDPIEALTSVVHDEVVFVCVVNNRDWPNGTKEPELAIVDVVEQDGPTSEFEVLAEKYGLHTVRLPAGVPINLAFKPENVTNGDLVRHTLTRHCNHYHKMPNPDKGTFSTRRLEDSPYLDQFVLGTIVNSEDGAQPVVILYQLGGNKRDTTDALEKIVEKINSMHEYDIYPLPMGTLFNPCDVPRCKARNLFYANNDDEAMFEMVGGNSKKK